MFPLFALAVSAIIDYTYSLSLPFSPGWRLVMEFDPSRQELCGPGGSLPLAADDDLTRKLSMIIEGECEGLGPSAAAAKYGFSKPRYFQLRSLYLQRGAAALLNHKRGPKSR